MTDIVRQLGALHIDDRLCSIPEDEAVTHYGDETPVLDITQLPNTCVHAIFQHLDAADKYSLFCTSKSVRELFSHHLCSISVHLPPDEEYIRGYGCLPRTLQGLPPSMHNLRVRIIRKFFNPNQGGRLMASGEPLPHSQLALEDFISCEGKPKKDKLMSKADRIELQGYSLTSSVASCLAANCHACTHVRLSDVDLRGPFLQGLTSLSNCSQLELSHVHLLDAAAHASLASLSSMRSLKSLVLARVMYAECPLPSDSVPDGVPIQTSNIFHQLSLIGSCSHPDFSFITQLPGLQNLRIQLALGLSHAPSAAQFVALASNCPHLQSLAVVGLEGLQYLSNKDLEPLVNGCGSSLRSLQFDQHVVITGVQALLRLKHLEHVCARSLEPRPYECFADVNPCSLRSLSLGGCCPSVSALAALPLHSLTHHLDITKLDLAPFSRNDPATMSDVLAAAVHNMARCPSLRIMGGKLELSGRPMPLSLPPPPPPFLATHSASTQNSQTGLVTAVAPILALQPLSSRGLTHLKLSGFVVTASHMQALSAALGPGLTALTFADCTMDAAALKALTSHGGAFPQLHQVSFARYCLGVDLRTLTDQLVSSDAAPLQYYLLYHLGPENTSQEGLVGSDASVGEAMQEIIGVHGFGRIQLHVRWSV